MKFTLNDNNTPIVKDHSFLSDLMHLGDHPGLALVPVSDVSDDELLQGIRDETEADTITLEETPDPEKLNAFWTTVQEDIKTDPEWFNFAED